MKMRRGELLILPNAKSTRACSLHRTLAKVPLFQVAPLSVVPVTKSRSLSRGPLTTCLAAAALATDPLSRNGRCPAAVPVPEKPWPAQGLDFGLLSLRGSSHHPDLQAEGRSWLLTHTRAAGRDRAGSEPSWAEAKQSRGDSPGSGPSRQTQEPGWPGEDESRVRDAERGRPLSRLF